MPCTATVEGRQTEFEFYQQLTNFKDGKTCCGPKVGIVFDRLGISVLVRLFAELGMGTNYLDNFDPVVLDSRNLRLSMCSRHWLQMSDVLHRLSHQMRCMDLNDMAFYMHKTACLLNGWDEKELVNYLS
jgi:hypothetical protein